MESARILFTSPSIQSLTAAQLISFSWCPCHILCHQTLPPRYISSLFVWSVKVFRFCRRRYSWWRRSHDADEQQFVLKDCVVCFTNCETWSKMAIKLMGRHFIYLLRKCVCWLSRGLLKSGSQSFFFFFKKSTIRTNSNLPRGIKKQHQIHIGHNNSLKEVSWLNELHKMVRRLEADHKTKPTNLNKA